MAQTQASELVTLKENGEAVTTSLLVAERFGKRHDDVLKSIRNLDCSKEFRSRNFAETPYTHPQNKRTFSMFEITKDGFSFLVLGFTGKPAAELKEAFIAAFNRLLETKRLSTPLSRQDQIMNAMQFLIEDKAALERQLEQKQDQILLQAHEAAIAQPKVDYYDNVLDSGNGILPSKIASQLGMGAGTLNSILHGLGVIYKMDGAWLIYAQHREKGLHVYKVGFYLKEGEKCTNQSLRWTEKGRLFIHELIKNYRKGGDIQASKN
jgi:Rha family phage regulatory protein